MTRHTVRPWSILLVTLLVLGATLTGVNASTEHAQAADEPTITLLAASPAVLGPGSQLSLTVRIHNGTSTAVTAATAGVAVSTRVIGSRNALKAWSTRSLSDPIGTLVDEIALVDLAPGDSTEVGLTVHASALGIGEHSDWGPRGMTVTLSTAGTRRTALRTFAVGAPSEPVTPLGLTVLAAVTGPPLGMPTASDRTSAYDRVDALVSATQFHPEIGWIVDPALIKATDQVWAERILDTLDGRDIAALPAYDIDLAGYAHNPAIPLPPDEMHHDSRTQGWRRDIAWPASSDPDLATVSYGVAQAMTGVIVESGLQPTDELTYTPSAPAVVATPAGEATALVCDPALSELFSSATGPESAQRILAETAVLARERPAEQRTVLATLDRDWQPNATVLDATMSALRAASWVQFTDLETLLSTPPSDITRAPLADRIIAEEEIPGSLLADLHAARTRTRTFATVVSEPERITATMDKQLAAPAAIAYRSDTKAQRAAVRAALSAVEKLTTTSITIVDRQPARLLGESVKYPVRLRNSLDQEATVNVVVTAEDSRVTPRDHVTVRVPPRGEKVAYIGLDAVGSGTILVRVSARSPGSAGVPGGTDVAQPVTMRLILQPELEWVGTWIFGITLALLLIGGIWRTIRRGHSPHRTGGPVDTLAGQEVPL